MEPEAHEPFTRKECIYVMTDQSRRQSPFKIKYLVLDFGRQAECQVRNRSRIEQETVPRG